MGKEASLKILEKTLNIVKSKFNVDLKNIKASIGPSIGPLLL